MLLDAGDIGMIKGILIENCLVPHNFVCTFLCNGILLCYASYLTVERWNVITTVYYCRFKWYGIAIFPMKVCKGAAVLNFHIAARPRISPYMVSHRRQRKLLNHLSDSLVEISTWQPRSQPATSILCPPFTKHLSYWMLAGPQLTVAFHILGVDSIGII